jgi:DNA-binding NarL/FixJ family response regulator
MIYFVDEDNHLWKAWTDALRDAVASEVVEVWNANEAYETLKRATPTETDLAIIDVMLSVENVANEQFSVERTRNYSQTGVCLLEDLAQANPAVFPQYAVFLTNAIGTPLEAVRAAADEYDVLLWAKSDLGPPADFVERVVDHIASLPKPTGSRHR